METTLYNHISTDTAVQIIRDFAKNAKTVQARHFIRTNNTESGEVTPPIVGLDVTLKAEQWEALIAYADKIIFWHYDFSPDCGRDISIHLGHANYCISVA